ncbi:MAG: hypothetical protein HYW05_01750 [Candidatus Diapherotrites archaeon]|nr:hypothetical protein [Candidatus Diapherotrites archaeon]
MKGNEAEYLINLRECFNQPKPRRLKKAIRIVKEFVDKHCRVKADNVVIGNSVNEAVYKGGDSPSRKLSVVLRRKENKIFVHMEGSKELEKAEKKPEEKKRREKPKTPEEIKAEEEAKKKVEEKRLMESAAEKAAIKKG